MKKEHGFTLIEVIVAISLFAISALMLSQSFVNALFCKASMQKENTNDIKIELIRCSLLDIKRNDVAKNNELYMPTQESEKFTWTGKVLPTKILGLYVVTIQINSSEETLDFWTSRHDWITASERSQLENKAN